MGTRDEYVKALKSAFVTLGTRGLMAYLAVQDPIIVTNPILKYIVENIIEFLLESLTNVTEMGVFFLYTDFRVSAQGTVFMEAAKSNQEAKNKSPKEKALAENNLIDKFRILAKLTS